MLESLLWVVQRCLHRGLASSNVIADNDLRIKMSDGPACAHSVFKGNSLSYLAPEQRVPANQLPLYERATLLSDRIYEASEPVSLEKCEYILLITSMLS